MKDIMGLMKQVQGMQARLGELQAELENAESEGVSGGGLVRVVLSGKGQMKRVSIDPSLLAPGEGEILEDLIVAAHNEAKAKSEGMMAERMKDITGGLPLPPGMKLPF
jgi:DNA-binding YbaB/EbfC family protein